MRVRFARLAAAFLLASAGEVAAAGFDGKTPLECAPAAASECDTSAECETVTLDEIGVPGPIRVDFKAKKLLSMDGQRSSPIRSVEVSDTVLILQGSQNGRGWSMAIDRASGAMSGTIAETAGAFVLSGACKAP